MKKEIIKHVNLKPSSNNIYIWLNAVALLILLLIGKASGVVIVIAFFLETIIIGLLHSFKMIASIRYWKRTTHNTPKNNSYGFVLFFLFHYGFFITVQLIFVFAILKITENNFDPFDLFKNLDYALNLEGMYWVLGSILIFSLSDFYFNYLKTNQHKKNTVDSLFMQPYKRILMQQFAVILGSSFIGWKAAITVVAILLIIFKTMIDLIFAKPK